MISISNVHHKHTFIHTNVDLLLTFNHLFLWPRKILFSIRYNYTYINWIEEVKEIHPIIISRAMFIILPHLLRFQKHSQLPIVYIDAVMFRNYHSFAHTQKKNENIIMNVMKLFFKQWFLPMHLQVYRYYFYLLLLILNVASNWCGIFVSIISCNLLNSISLIDRVIMKPSHLAQRLIN